MSELELPKQESVTVVITTHGYGLDLPGILNTLECQREYGVGKHTRTGGTVLWVAGNKLDCKVFPTDVIITCDGEFEGEYPLALGAYNVYVPVINNPYGGAPGHHTRQAGIDAAKGDWVVLTNSDNLFFHGWRHRIAGELKPENCMVVWNGISNLWVWGDHGGSRLARGRIDLSFACVRTEIAKKIGFPFREYDGDFEYLSACAAEGRKQGLKIVYLQERLSVHN